MVILSDVLATDRKSSRTEDGLLYTRQVTTRRDIDANCFSYFHVSYFVPAFGHGLVTMNEIKITNEVSYANYKSTTAINSDCTAL